MTPLNSNAANFFMYGPVSTFGKNEQPKVSKFDSINSAQNCLLAPRRLTLTDDFLHRVWPSKINPPSLLSEMNVMETSVWILIFAGLKGWEEASRYSQSFMTNWIS